MTLHRARERAIIARLMIDVIKAVHKGRLGSRVSGSIGGEVELLLISAAVLIGHVEHRPKNAAEVSRLVGIPRATVQRKIGMLVRRGVVERLDGGRFMPTDKTGDDYSYVDLSLSLIRDAARKIGGSST